MCATKEKIYTQIHKRYKDTFSAVWKYCFTRSSTLSVTPSEAGLLNSFPKLRSLSKTEKHSDTVTHNSCRNWQILIILIIVSKEEKIYNIGLLGIMVPFMCKGLFKLYTTGCKHSKYNRWNIYTKQPHSSWIQKILLTTELLELGTEHHILKAIIIWLVDRE